MADFLAPKIDGSAAAFEQPISAPSSFGALAGLAGSFLSTQSTSTPKPTADEMFGAAWLKFQEDEGLAFDPSNPTHLQGRLVKFINQNPQFTGHAVELGNAAGLELVTPEARQASYEQELVSTESYQAQRSLFSITHPDWSESEVHAASINAVTTKQATDARIANSQTNKSNNWLDIEGAYTDRAVQLTDTFRAAVVTIEEDQVITPEEAKQIRSIYNNQLGGLTRPAGVPEDEWSTFQTGYVQPIGQILEGVVNLEGNLNSDMKAALDQILAKAVSQGKLPPALLIKFQEGTDGSYTSLTNLLNQAVTAGGEGAQGFLDNYRDVLGMSFDDLLDWVTEFEFQDTSYLDNVDLKGFNSLGGAAQAESLLTDARNVVGSVNSPEQLAVDLTNIIEKTNSLDNTTLAPNDFNRIFSKGFFNSLVKVNDVNPAIGEELVTRTREAISGQLATVVTAVHNQASSSGFTITPEGGVEAIPSQMTASMQRAVEEHWSGDWEQAFRDGGKTPTGFVLSEFSKFSKLFKEIELGSKYITTLRGSLGTLEETMPQAFASTTELPGPDDVSSGMGGLQALTDSSEGLGDYDTLWASSQRDGKPFSGTRVSEMTLGEIKEFASTKGRYGQYVQRTNPEGVLATPMGRYQFVGTTLAEVAKQMGLSDRTVFSSEVQDAMFAHRVQWRLGKANTVEGKMKQLRLEWAGFKGVGDADLARAIEQFEQGTPITATSLSPPTQVTEAPVRRGGPQVEDRVSNAIVEAGGDPATVKSYATEDEARAALDRGEVSLGDIVLIGGRAVRVEGDA